MSQLRAETPRGSPLTWESWCFLSYKKTCCSGFHRPVCGCAHVAMILSFLKCVSLYLRAKGTWPFICHCWAVMSQTGFKQLLTNDWKSCEDLNSIHLINMLHADSLKPPKRGSGEFLFQDYFEDILRSCSACLFPAFPRIRQTTWISGFPCCGTLNCCAEK